MSQLDAEMIRFRDEVAAAYGAFPSFSTLAPAEARRVAEAVRRPWAAGGPTMAISRDLHVEAEGRRFALRLNQPSAAPGGVMVYLHGGGWTLFSNATHDRLMREYAARTGLAVIGLDYSLAPEARFPTPVLEASALVRWLRTPQAGEVLGFAAHALKLVVGGDSAGGNLAMGAAIALRDDGADLIDALVLNYAVVDADDTPASYTLFDGPGFNLERHEMHRFWAAYVPDPARRRDQRVGLLHGSLAGLPPTLLVVAECDVLRDENLTLAARLETDGTPVTLRRYAGMLHSFLEAVSICPVSVRAFDETAAWIAQIPDKRG